MFARVEIAYRPEFADPVAEGVLRRLGLAFPELRKKVRWARWIDVHWLELPLSREEMIPAITEIYWDRVLHWLFSGNLIPSAAGKHGGILDLMEAAPNRPGRFWAIERRFRPGVTDPLARTGLEAFEILTHQKFPDAKSASGSLLLLEGPALDEDSLAVIAREVLCNELIETWTLLSETELARSDRFHQERIRRDLPRVSLRGSDQIETIPVSTLSDSELVALSQKRLWALSQAEMKAIQAQFDQQLEKERRAAIGMPSEPTDVEMEVLAQTWSEHCKHKIFGARIEYADATGSPSGRGEEIPKVVNGLFKSTIVATTEELPKDWLLSVFDDNAGIVAFDEEDAICIKVETHNSPSALDPYGGALTGIVGVNRDILGCGTGARPIFNTDVFCVAPPDYSQPLPDRILHPRRLLEGVRRGVEHGGNKSGIPTVNGALVFDERFLGKPLIFCGTGGIMPRVSAGRRCETKEVLPGDRICMVGGRIGKDGIHGATFSSLAFDERSPSSAVQLGDPLTQKRALDFVLEARDLGLYRAITDNGAGGLSSSVGEMARLSGGANMDVSKAKVKYPGLKPFELVVSESQERMTLAVPPEKLGIFLALASRRGVEVSDLGEFTDHGSFDVFHGEKRVASLPLEFLHGGCPKLELKGEWKRALPEIRGGEASFETDATSTLLELLGRPNISSKEWLIRQYDHEVQGMSVVKPLHTVQVGTPQATSGPNDGGVLQPKPSSLAGIAIGCGLNPKLSDFDPYWMAMAAVDEAVRNVLAVGAEFGRPESVLALIDNYCWPDPVGNPELTAALVRAGYGMRKAALELGTPFISGKDSMKNDYRGKRQGKEIKISVPPTLLVTAMAKVSDVRYARTADFKASGDFIYLLGGRSLGLVGSELHSLRGDQGLPVSHPRVPAPDWELARKVYGWLGGASGKEQARLRSVHDVSDGGVAVAVAEGLLARGLGAVLETDQEPWEFFFGEGFHGFVLSVADADSGLLEYEWKDLGVPFTRIGTVNATGRLEARRKGSRGLVADVASIRTAWKKEGYWE